MLTVCSSHFFVFYRCNHTILLGNPFNGLLSGEIHSLSLQLCLSIPYWPNSELGIVDATENKKAMAPALAEFTFPILTNSKLAEY